MNRKKTVTLLFSLTILLFTMPAMALYPPVGDEPGDYYRERELIRTPRQKRVFKDEKTRNAMLKMLSEKDRTVRAEAIRSFGVDANPEDTERILELVSDPVPEVRSEALKALSSISAQAFEKAASGSLANDGSPSVRMNAAMLLGEKKMGAAALGDALNDQDVRVRAAAVSSLELIGGPVAAKRLPSALEDPSPTVRANAARALARTAHPDAGKLLGPGMKDPHELVRGACASALGELGEESSKKVLSMLKSEDSRFVLQAVLGAIEQNTLSDALPDVHGLLNHADMGIRIAACKACGSTKDPSSAGPLGVLLADRQLMVRQAATAALVSLAGGPAEKEFCSALKHKLAIARREGAWGLGALKCMDGLQLLSTATGDEDEQVRTIAAWALGRLRDPEGGPALCGAATKDESPVVRVEAARSLGRVDTSEGRSVLVRLLDDEDDRVRARAARSIGELKHPAAAAVIKALNDYLASYTVREASAWTLGELESREAIPHLRKLLTQKVIPTPLGPVYDTTEPRIQVIRSLVKIGDEGFIGDVITEDMLTDRVFMAGYSLTAVVAEAFTHFTGKKHDWLRPRETYEYWFVESISFVSTAYDKQRPLVFPVEE